MPVNVLNQFKTLKVRQQFLLLILLSAAIPASVVGILGTISASTALSDKATGLVERETEESVQEIDAFLSSIDQDVVVLSQAPSVQGIIRARDNKGTDPTTEFSYDDWMSQLKLNFSVMLQEKEFNRLEYIDETGKTLVVVETDDHGNSEEEEEGEEGASSELPNEGEVDDNDDELEGEEAIEKSINILPIDKIENQADSSYFVKAMELSPGELYASPITLRRENGAITEPYEPVIQYATPVVNEAGQKRGIIVATVFTNEFLDELNEEEGQFEGEATTLVNVDGYYLAHPDPEKRWGFEFGKETTLAKEISADVAEQILSGGTDTIELDTYVVAYETLSLGPDPSSNLIAVTKVPVEKILEPVNLFKRSAALAVLVSLGIVLPLAIFRGRQLINLRA
ncbi:cache domain-containing protein [Leptothoe sp. PORK10 BA2]|uniref:cache domain-containing protein n=1 Tax=Leptothoe sp. PORK10 BA2 TaxID=3110254 RepID=UPI002B1EEC5B|nr:cache domain-containing protein [Leptothoe sp. PORK10 BA2]MEA5464988.1 cache domain-containing protein [Leptothoe sp. PORK10 BA2]